MRIPEFERKLLDMPDNPVIIAISSAGINKYIGSIYATAVVYNYNKYPDLEVNSGNLDTIMEKVNEAAPLSFTYKLPVAKINELKNLELADHYARFKALDGLCWCKLYPQKILPNIILSNQMKYQDIIEDSMYGDLVTTSDIYEHLQGVHGISKNNLYAQKDGHLVSPSLFCADLLSEYAYREELSKLNKELPQYDVLNSSVNITDKHISILQAHGRTNVHRFNIPEFDKYREVCVIKESATAVDTGNIDASSYVNLFNSMNHGD